MSLMKSYSPEELYQKFQKARDGVSDERFFNAPSSGKIQELWCGARFGQLFEGLYGQCRILIADDDLQKIDDFSIEHNGHIERIQITECMEPGRRRGLEYKGDKSPDSAEANKRWRKGTENALDWIKESVEKKTRKYGHSSLNVGLLVYLNFRAFDLNYYEIQKAVNTYKERWSSIWLFGSHGLACFKPFSGIDATSGWYKDEKLGE